MEKKAPLLSAPEDIRKAVVPPVVAASSRPQVLVESSSNRSRCTSFFKRRVFAQFANIRQGRLTLRETDQSTSFGDHNSPGTEIIIHNPRCYRRLALGGAIGAAESFIDGDWSTPDLIDVIRVFAKNEVYLKEINHG